MPNSRKKLKIREVVNFSSSPSSIDATNLGGFWPALRFHSTIYIYLNYSLELSQQYSF
jgi:hypothetical protein